MEIGYQFKNPWLNFPSLILNKFLLIHGHWLGKGACHVWYGYKAERENETYQEKLVNTVFSWVENWGFQILNTFSNRLHSTWSNKMGGKFNCSLLWSCQSEQISKVELTWNDNWVWNYGLKQISVLSLILQRPNPTNYDNGRISSSAHWLKAERMKIDRETYQENWAEVTVHSPTFVKRTCRKAS